MKIVSGKRLKKNKSFQTEEKKVHSTIKIHRAKFLFQNKILENIF